MTPSNQSATVSYFPDGQYEFTQDGTNIPCLNTNTPPTPYEFDIVAQANTPTNENNAPTANNPNYAPTLDQISHLNASLVIDILDAEAITNYTCSTTQFAWGFTVVFSDSTASQTLFYQVRLAHGTVSGNPKSFAFDSSPAGFYNTGNPYYGYNEPVTDFSNNNYATLGVSTPYDIDIYSAVKGVITSPKLGGGLPVPMDSALRHWNIVGVYHGGALFGPVHTDTKWKFQSITAN